MIIVRILLNHALALLLLSMTVLPAASETRIALVIGNGTYSEFGALINPIKDAALMADTLNELNFDVISASDLDQDGMKQAIKQFGRRLDEAGNDVIGLFYYAGHGVQSDGTNFLVPVTASIEREIDIPVETVNLDWVLAQMKFASTRVNIVIMDACRNNPIVRSLRSGTRGLAQIEAPRGSLIAYATAPGGVAADGVGANSPYTAALAKNLKQPGLVLEEVFRQTRVDVLEATAGEQVPWESSSLTGAFYFTDPESVEEIAAVEAQPADEAQSKDTGQADSPSLNDIKDGVESALLRHSPALQSSSIFTIKPLDTTMFVQERANIRVQPVASAELVMTVEPGLELKVTGEAAGRDWYRVSLADDRPGFIWKPLLGIAMPDAVVAAINNEQAAAEAADAPSSYKELTGLWSGRFRCQQDVIGLTLDLVEHNDHTLGGIFKFYPETGSPSFPEGSYSMEGFVDPLEQLVDLRGTSWIDRPFGFQRHDLRGRIDHDQNEITGQVLTTGCADFVLRRKTAESRY